MTAYALQPWQVFLTALAGWINRHQQAAIDFLAGMTPGPDDAWIRQVGRNLTGPVGGFFREKRSCLMDRDVKFTTAIRTLMAGAGIEPVRLSPRSPNLSAWVERFMRPIKWERLDRMIFFGEDSLRRAVREYVAHDHAERNHQGLGNPIIAPVPRPYQGVRARALP